MTGVICGTGACVPDRILDNNEIAQFVDTSDQWIQERTGVIRRRIAQTETTASMAAEAGRQALEEAGIRPEEIDMILAATATPDHIFPCAACEIQERLQAVNAVCFDLNAACSGFLFAYQTAQAYITSGMYRTILVVGSESLSRIVNWEDRGTCILFGDGSGAAVLRAKEGRNWIPAAHSDGKGGPALLCPGPNVSGNGGNLPGSDSAEDSGLERTGITMDGKAVFQFAVRKVPEVIREVLDANGLSADDIDWFILHQANRRIVESVAKRLKTDIERFPMNLQEYGNTSSASIPILLNEMNRKGLLKKGQKLVMAGFGAGLSWGAAVLEWGI
ncbi:MAG TPA: ketoacyl-ACP synthase III [Candidatus Blautia excrementigallinarum]|nr:ketoacyl-ACP synthase III [Candidatus Blautia excrementigallinarum]